MDQEQLRTAQAPLKARYRDDPSAAIVPVAAEARFGDPVTVTVDTWAGEVRAGLHRATGGDGSDACSADMLLQALVACAGVTLHTVATAYGIALREVAVRADGVFDVRGTLGLDRSVDVGVQDVRVVAEVVTDADDALLAKLAAATERYCVVGRSLRHPPSIEVCRRVTREQA